MPHNITLLFNVEDLCWPGSDDITLELATRLSRHGVQGTFLIVGEKAKLFAERSRSDIIAALQGHDLGSHSTRHSIHPTVAEYLAGAEWDDGVLTAMDEEGLGLATLEQVFGRRPAVWGQPGGSWGPHIHTALYRLNTTAVLYPRTRIDRCADLHWYAGALVFPGHAIASFDAALIDDDKFEQALQHMAEHLEERIVNGTRWSGIFVCHPTRLRAFEFWDKLNYAQGANPEGTAYRMPTLLNDEAYQTALKNFDRLIEILKQDRRLQIKTIADLQRTFIPPGEDVYLHQIDRAVAEVVKEEDILTHFYRFSPAELLDLLVRAYTNPEFEIESLRRRMVLGPTDDPPPPYPHEDFVYWDDFLSACGIVANHVTQQGRLPASVYLKGDQWSIGTFYRVAMEVWFNFRVGSPPSYVDWKPGYLYPTVGHEIAVAVQEAYEAWPIHQPDLDLNRLLMHTCFQCWTLRPAYE